MREVRLALLEADVNYKVVKDFVARVRERAVGAEILESLNAGQQVIKIVHEELTAMLGAGDRTFRLTGSPSVVPWSACRARARRRRRPSSLGTSSGRAAGRCWSPRILPTGRHRQLMALGRSLDIPVHRRRRDAGARHRSRRRRRGPTQSGRDTVILDTAGRLTVDATLMAEIRASQQPSGRARCCSWSTPWSGQDAVAVAEAFRDAVPLTGLVLTKIDGDARGGAALSISA